MYNWSDLMIPLLMNIVWLLLLTLMLMFVSERFYRRPRAAGFEHNDHAHQQDSTWLPFVCVVFVYLEVRAIQIIHIEFVIAIQVYAVHHSYTERSLHVLHSNWSSHSQQTSIGSHQQLTIRRFSIREPYVCVYVFSPRTHLFVISNLAFILFPIFRILQCIRLKLNYFMCAMSKIFLLQSGS